MKYQEWHTSDRLCKAWKDDCTVRSLSIVLGETYKKVFEDLMHFGLQIGAYPDCDKVWKAYAEDQGLIKRKCPRDQNGKLIKLGDWDFMGTAVVINSGHLTAVDGGYVVDIWDCRYRPVNTYFERVGVQS